MGYSYSRKAYKVLSLEDFKVIESRDMVFEKSIFSFEHIEGMNSSITLICSASFDEGKRNNVPFSSGQPEHFHEPAIHEGESSQRSTPPHRLSFRVPKIPLYLKDYEHYKPSHLGDLVQFYCLFSVAQEKIASLDEICEPK